MAYYFLAHFTVHDLETFSQYPPAVNPIIAKHGGKVLTVTSRADIGTGVPEPLVIEGNPQHMVTVVVEFPSRAAFEEWYQSPEFQRISNFRTSASTGWALGLPEFTLPEQLR